MRDAGNSWSLPIDMGRPVVEHEPGKHRRRGHRGVVGPRELGIGQQRVEEPARQVVPLEVASLLHRPQEGCDDRPLQLRSPDIEHIEDVDRKLEDGNVVDVFANIPPGVAETGETLVQRFRTRLHVLVDLCEPFLEGQGVEENETADAQSGGAVFLLIGLGNYVGDETGDARVAG